MVKFSNDFNLNIDGKKVQSERDAIEILAKSFNIRLPAKQNMIQ